MNDLQIKYFLILAQSKSFSKAAEQLYMSQPSLSKQIGALEQELELKLFERKYREVILTKEGQLFYDYFMEATQKFNDTLYKAQNVGLLSTHLSMVMLEGLDTNLALRPIRRFQNEHKEHNITFSFEQLPSYQIPFYLINDRYDIAVTLEDRVTLTQEYANKIRTKKISDCEILLYYSTEHKVNQLERQPVFEDFKDDIFFLPTFMSKHHLNNSPNSQLSAVEYYSQLLGYTPRIEFVNSTAAIQPNVECGAGVSLISSLAFMRNSSYLNSIPLNAKSNVVVAWKAGNTNPLIDQFVDTIEDK